MWSANNITLTYNGVEFVNGFLHCLEERCVIAVWWYEQFLQHCSHILSQKHFS